MAATVYEHHVLSQVRVQRCCVPNPDNCLEHLGLYVLVFEHDCVVIGDGDGPVQVIDPRHISHWRTVAHTAQGWSDRRATRQSVSL